MALSRPQGQEKDTSSKNGSASSLLTVINDNLYIFARQEDETASINPLYSFDFPFLCPKKFMDHEKFNVQYPDVSYIQTVGDRIRYYRYKKALLQQDVADYAGLYRSSYIHYENSNRDYYPIEKLRKIAELLEVDITDLLDEYNRFLYDGQGSQIRAIRTKLGLTQYEFGRLIGVNAGTVKRWESERARISKRKWEKVMQCYREKE